MLRLFGAMGRVPAVTAQSGFLDSTQTQRSSAFHIIVPGDVQNAGANRNGVALMQQLALTRADVALWSEPSLELPMADVPNAVEIDPDRERMPRGGTIAVFGINARTLSWLPDAADSFDAIVVGLDAHDPMTYVDLIDRIPAPALARLRVVARSPELLADLGLPGAVDSMEFSAVAAHPARARPVTARRRIGVFIPPLRSRADKLRWDMLQWLRAQSLFLRLMYPGRLPSRHIEDDQEHLISLVTDWQDWWCGLDGLFFWGAEGRMRQFDRLVFEAAAAGLSIVADGYGDYGAALAGNSRCHLFFDVDEARRAMDAMIAAPGRADVHEPALP
jgi:hypothetical protein